MNVHKWFIILVSRVYLEAAVCIRVLLAHSIVALYLRLMLLKLFLLIQDVSSSAIMVHLICNIICGMINLRFRSILCTNFSVWLLPIVNRSCGHRSNSTVLFIC